MRIYTQTKLNAIIRAGGKWYNEQNHCIERRMKNVDKLLEFADTIAKVAFTPNAMNGGDEYTGNYRYRENLMLNGIEGYYAEVSPTYAADHDRHPILPITGTVTKSSALWTYTLNNVRLHK